MKATITLSLVSILSGALARELRSAINSDRIMGRRNGVHTQLSRENIRDFIRGLPKSERGFARDCLRDDFKALRRANQCFVRHEPRLQPLSAR